MSSEHHADAFEHALTALLRVPVTRIPAPASGWAEGAVVTPVARIDSTTIEVRVGGVPTCHHAHGVWVNDNHDTGDEHRAPRLRL